jgi:hypothetical protein
MLSHTKTWKFSNMYICTLKISSVFNLLLGSTTFWSTKLLEARFWWGGDRAFQFFWIFDWYLVSVSFPEPNPESSPSPIKSSSYSPQKIIVLNISIATFGNIKLKLWKTGKNLKENKYTQHVENRKQCQQKTKWKNELKRRIEKLNRNGVTKAWKAAIIKCLSKTTKIKFSVWETIKRNRKLIFRWFFDCIEYSIKIPFFLHFLLPFRLENR